MDIFKELYLHLFNQVTDAIAAIQARNYGVAEELLRKAQIECEERYIAQCEHSEAK